MMMMMTPLAGGKQLEILKTSTEVYFDAGIKVPASCYQPSSQKHHAARHSTFPVLRFVDAQEARSLLK